MPLSGLDILFVDGARSEQLMRYCNMTLTTTNFHRKRINIIDFTDVSAPLTNYKKIRIFVKTLTKSSGYCSKGHCLFKPYPFNMLDIAPANPKVYNQEPTVQD
jgi:hypothetical protein